MKNYFKLFYALPVILAMFLISCEGPAGPAGAAGKDGADGNATCNLCHGASATDVNLKFNQYNFSKHNKGIVYEEEAGRVACGGCHSGDGFAEAVALGQDDAKTLATAPINCKACHPIHTDYAMTDFALRTTAAFKLRITGNTVQHGKGTLCSKCHQGRAFVRTVPDTIKAASSSSSYSRFGPHYGTQTNVYTMNGPVQLAGSATYPTSNPHAAIANAPNGCVTCHMSNDPANPAVGGHTFLSPAANLSTITTCYGCHDAATMKSGTLTKAVAADIATYRRLLIEKGMLDTSQAISEEGYVVLGEYFATPGGKTKVYTNPDDVSVVLNYLYVAKDRSNGVHNPAYIKALVKNGLEYLQK
jgi:hypothetical protein